MTFKPLLAAVFAAAALGSGGVPGVTTAASAQTPAAAAPAPETRPVATIETNRGTITIRLYPDEAPLAAANFIKLADKGFYDGLRFHRVEPGFVIQGGDPLGNGRGGPGYKIPDEANKTLKHVVGAVAMAKAGPNAAGSQFYIVIGQPAPRLDGRYTIFGQVIDGQDVAERIRIGDRMLKISIAEPPAPAAPVPPVEPPAPAVLPARPTKLVAPEAPPLPLPADKRGKNAKVVFSPKPDLPLRLRSTEFAAFVQVQAEISDAGRATYTMPQGSGNKDVDNAVKDALKKWKWQPAEKDGKRVASTQKFRFEFDNR